MFPIHCRIATRLQGYHTPACSVCTVDLYAVQRVCFNFVISNIPYIFADFNYFCQDNAFLTMHDTESRGISVFLDSIYFCQDDAYISQDASSTSVPCCLFLQNAKAPSSTTLWHFVMVVAAAVAVSYSFCLP